VFLDEFPNSAKNKTTGAGDTFFNDVEADAARILKKDKLQEEYQKVATSSLIGAEVV